MKRPPTEPWVYRSLSGGVYDCRTKEEGRLEIVGPVFRFVADDIDTLNAVLDWCRRRGLGVSFKYYEISDQWALVTWSPAKRECLETKESSTIDIAFDRLKVMWGEVTDGTRAEDAGEGGD